MKSGQGVGTAAAVCATCEPHFDGKQILLLGRCPSLCFSNLSQQGMRIVAAALLSASHILKLQDSNVSECFAFIFIIIMVWQMMYESILMFINDYVY